MARSSAHISVRGKALAGTALGIAAASVGIADQAHAAPATFCGERPAGSAAPTAAGPVSVSSQDFPADTYSQHVPDQVGSLAVGASHAVCFSYRLDGASAGNGVGFRNADGQGRAQITLLTPAPGNHDLVVQGFDAGGAPTAPVDYRFATVRNPVGASPSSSPWGLALAPNVFLTGPNTVQADYEVRGVSEVYNPFSSTYDWGDGTPADTVDGQPLLTPTPHRASTSCGSLSPRRTTSTRAAPAARAPWSRCRCPT
ncbi:hypothetical protein ACFQ9X_45205 [Catenulispora yoronensis]